MSRSSPRDLSYNKVILQCRRPERDPYGEECICWREVKKSLWKIIAKMSLTHVVKGRQIWALSSSTISSNHRHCTPFHLPSHGIISIDSTSTITLTQNAIFEPQCTSLPSAYQNGSEVSSSVIDLRDPFYASTSPQIYAIATATVISWMLVIMLFITPRTYFVGGAGGSGGFLGRRGMISGMSGNIIGVGGRPLLQKVATLTVAISLTIATVSTFQVAEEQYNDGYQDAIALTEEVVGGLELRVIRVISDTALWLAQVQTLIRLFPRHREKVIIKWAGFALIILDTMFSMLNSFVDNSVKTRPRSFTDAIPALSYLFELALSLLYAAWVIYYSLHKRRFAFFHPLMRNIFLVAAISLIAVLIPVVFFILDIANPSLDGWGDYIRWVGAAAASVVVWEWVERIEALEREERKDGILGREIFDGDEMLEATPSTESEWPRYHLGYPGSGRGHAAAIGKGQQRAGNVTHRTATSAAPHLNENHRREFRHRTSKLQGTSIGGAMSRSEIPRHTGPTHPLPIASPVSRTDTTSAASTVYAVRYHPISQSPSPCTSIEQPIVRFNSEIPSPPSGVLQPIPIVNTQKHAVRKSLTGTAFASGSSALNEGPIVSRPDKINRWQNVTNPFKRRRTSPPPQVSQAAAAAAVTQPDPRPGIPAHKSSKLGRLHMRRSAKQADAPLPTMVIPVASTGGIWSPATVLENEANGSSEPSEVSSLSHGAVARENNESPESSRAASAGRYSRLSIEAHTTWVRPYPLETIASSSLSPDMQSDTSGDAQQEMSLQRTANALDETSQSAHTSRTADLGPDGD